MLSAKGSKVSRGKPNRVPGLDPYPRYQYRPMARPGQITPLEP